MWESRSEVGGLGRAASPRPPSRAIDPAGAGIAHAKGAKGKFLILPRIRGTRSRADSSRKGRKGNSGGRD